MSSSKPVQTIRKGLKIVGLNLLSVLFLGLLFEGCVRIIHPEIKPLSTDSIFVRDNMMSGSSGLAPGVSGKSMGQSFTVTKDGFWKYSGSGANGSETGTPSWLFLGDSVTMGMGIDPDSSFAGRISNAVDDSLRVLNPSLIGYSSRDYVNVVRELAQSDKYEIRRITVFWCLNDAYSKSSGTWTGAGVAAGDAPVGLVQAVPVLSSFIYRHVRAYQWLKKLAFDRPKAYYLFDKTLYIPGSKSFESVREDVGLIKRNGT